MATYTTNLGLKKPAQSDKIRIADFNNNADNIDAAIGADFGQNSKPSINSAINSLADGLAIVAQGDVHAAIAAGQFVYVRGHGTLAEGLYVAQSAISANGSLTSSNLTADTSGGLNALNSNKLSFSSVGSLTSSSPVSFTVQSNTFGMLAIVGTVTGRCGLYLFRTSSSAVYVTPIHDSNVGESVTVTTNGFTATLASDSTSGSGVYAIFFSGGFAS